MWGLPGPGLEPVSPALAGGFLTTAPPGKPRVIVFLLFFKIYLTFEHLKISITEYKLVSYVHMYMYIHIHFLDKNSHSIKTRITIGNIIK